MSNTYRNAFLVVTITESGKHYAFHISVGMNDNLVSVLSGIKDLAAAQICETRKRAKEIADFWNQCYRENGTYLFGDWKGVT